MYAKSLLAIISISGYELLLACLDFVHAVRLGDNDVSDAGAQDAAAR